jgi:hypothetical protein
LFIINLIKSKKKKIIFCFFSLQKKQKIIPLTSFTGSRISPSSSLSKSYGFFPIVVVVNNDVSLFPLTVRVLLCDDESDDCDERSRKR